MIPRVVIGQRVAGSSEFGIWASPAGVNAETASPTSLILQMTNLVDQILAAGSVAGSTTVPLGLNARPIALLSRGGLSSIVGLSNIVVRPYPFGFYTDNAFMSVSASSLSISASGVCDYVVFKRAF